MGSWALLRDRRDATRQPASACSGSLTTATDKVERHGREWRPARSPARASSRLPGPGGRTDDGNQTGRPSDHRSCERTAVRMRIARRLGAAVAAGAVATLASVMLAGPAWAHVTVDPSSAPKG